MMGSIPYDRFGKPYNVSRVLNPDQTLNVTAYEEYSPLYLPAAYAITYLIAFVLSSAVLVHTGLYYGPTLVNGFKRIQIEKDDIHAKLMRSYPEVPDWWYLSVFVLFFALMIVAQEVRLIFHFTELSLTDVSGLENGYACLGPLAVNSFANPVHPAGWAHLRDVGSNSKFSASLSIRIAQFKFSGCSQSVGPNHTRRFTPRQADREHGAYAAVLSTCVQ